MIVTPLYAGLLGLLYLFLSVRVVAVRLHGPSLGDGGDPRMFARMRAHGNFAEYVPLVLLMMALMEHSHTFSIHVVHATGILLLLGRVLHAWGIVRPAPNASRALGAVLTFVALGLASLVCLAQGVHGMIISSALGV